MERREKMQLKGILIKSIERSKNYLQGQMATPDQLLPGLRQ